MKPQPSFRPRHPEVLVGPLVTLAAVIALLIVARYYDRLPVHPPECGFRRALGIPCVGCGGTRSMQALADGRISDALRFNPAAVLGVAASLLWAIGGWVRYQRGTPLYPVAEQNRLIMRNLLVVAALLLLNWIYLILFLP